jgi:hypothetical protein
MNHSAEIILDYVCSVANGVMQILLVVSTLKTSWGHYLVDIAKGQPKAIQNIHGSVKLCHVHENV